MHHDIGIIHPWILWAKLPGLDFLEWTSHLISSHQT